MKTSKKNILTYTALTIAIGLAIFYSFKVNKLQHELASSSERESKMAQKIAAEDVLFHIDSLLLKDDFTAALNAYQEQKSEVGQLEDGTVELRIAVANKFLALNEDLAVKSPEAILNDVEESIEIDKTPSPKELQQVDSLNFALEKTKVQLARLKRQLSNKAQGKYLTFKSTKGSDMHYVGRVKAGKANGHGLALLSTGSRYEGDWKDNLRHGEGTFFWPDGEYYIGEYKNDKRSGEGTYYWPNGEKFVGLWKDDQRTGEGSFFGKDGKVISGIWKDDKLVETHKKSKKQAVAMAGSGR